MTCVKRRSVDDGRVKSIADLVNHSEPGMALVRSWIAEAKNRVEELRCSTADGERALLTLQVTTFSPLGALAFESGGLLVDGGWLRILGAGCPRLPRALDVWNQFEGTAARRFPGTLLVGDDVLGGFFAMNGNAFPAPMGRVFYLAPDTLDWQDLELGYSEWLHWAFVGDLARFYDGSRWPGWEGDVAALPGDRGISVFPFLWAKGPPVAERQRRPVPLEELWNLHAIELPNQMTAGGSRVRR